MPGGEPALGGNSPVGGLGFSGPVSAALGRRRGRPRGWGRLLRCASDGRPRGWRREAATQPPVRWQGMAEHDVPSRPPAGLADGFGLGGPAGRGTASPRRAARAGWFPRSRPWTVIVGNATGGGRDSASESRLNVPGPRDGGPAISRRAPMSAVPVICGVVSTPSSAQRYAATRERPRSSQAGLCLCLRDCLQNHAATTLAWERERGRGANVLRRGDLVVVKAGIAGPTWFPGHERRGAGRQVAAQRRRRCAGRVAGQGEAIRFSPGGS